MENKGQSEPNEPDKNIFVIKSKPESLAGAESWLRGKGWTVNSTATVRDALPGIVEKKPKYVLVCMDHPNAKVRMLPKLLMQAFQAQVIPFVDSTNARSVALIAGQEYVLYPPITGTAIERMASKIERDKRRVDVEKQRPNSIAKSSLGTAETGVINIKGENSLAPSHVHVQEQARKALQELMKSDDTKPERITLESTEGKSFSTSSPGPAEGKKPGNSHHEPTTPHEKTMRDSSAAADDGRSKNFGAVGSTLKQNSSGEGDETNRSTSNGTPKGTISHDPIAERSGSVDPRDIGQSHSETKKNNSTVMTTEAAEIKKKVEPPSQPRGLRAKLAKAKALLNYIRPNSNLTQESGIVESVHIAVDLTAQPDHSQEIKTLGTCSEMICFPVGSSHHHGYMLCAIANNPEPLLSFTGLFRKKLIEIMGETEKHFTAGEPLPLNLSTVDFEAFAKHQAHFIVKFTHLNCECAVAYFDEEMPEPIFQTPLRADMIPVSLTEIPPERRLEFDIFLHLPQNEKFVRYGKKNNWISTTQKSKLVQRGVNTMHLHQSHRYDLFRHRLQLFMDDKIQQFFNSTREQTKAI